jgi:TonB family protein
MDQIKMSGPSGKIMLEGHYSKNEKTGTWTVYGAETLTIDYSELGRPVKVVDSLETCLKRKETFQTSRFIRKKDYAEIYSLLPKPRSKLTKLRADGTSNFWEEHPTFPDGPEGLSRFIGMFLKYPEEASRNNIKGQVIVEFTITQDGSMADFKIVKGIGYGCDEEAIRVLKLLPDWVPGFQSGKAVKTKFRLPMTFQ